MPENGTKDHAKRGTFNKTMFMARYTEQFKNVPRYSASSIPDLVRMLELMEQDPTITDIRWMAYMLATTFVESSATVRIKKHSKNKRGHLVTRTAKVWRNFAPVEEKGHGRRYRYGQPVKVDPLPDGSVRVTEHDGDQWTVLPNGHLQPTHRHQRHGADPHGRASHDYVHAGGDERVYDGRGFVQLTWWDNYVATGFMIGRGLDLLLDPDLVCEPELAYQILSTGMRTGAGFANGHTFREFFDGAHTDYVGARSMVNGRSGQHEIAALAERFERVLRAAATNPRPPGAS